jgi:NADPH2:quinone reductase
MKAAVYYEAGGPEVFRYEDVEDPKCTPDGVLIDVQVVSIEGGDVLHRAQGELTQRPHIVGYQCAGIVRQVGERVTDREPGQRVVAIMPAGSHAEQAVAAAGATWVLPDGADLASSACVPIPLGTADDCLFEFGHLRADETVLIHAGAGGVGISAIQLAHRHGARVLATASSDGKLDRLKDFGLDQGINYRERDFVEAVRELTDGKGPDLIVDSIGGRNLERSIEAVSYRGRVVSVGSAGREDYRPDLRLLPPGNKSLTGVFFGAELAVHHDRVHAMVQKHIEDVARERLRIPIDRHFPLSEAATAHAYLESRQAFGRVLLVP